MKKLSFVLPLLLLAGCATNKTATPAPSAPPQTSNSAIAACKSALALKQSVNAVQVLPMSHAKIADGFEVFLSLNGEQWLCTTDGYGNVNRLESRH